MNPQSIKMTLKQSLRYSVQEGFTTDDKSRKLAWVHDIYAGVIHGGSGNLGARFRENARTKCRQWENTWGDGWNSRGKANYTDTPRNFHWITGLLVDNGRPRTSLQAGNWQVLTVWGNPLFNKEDASLLRRWQRETVFKVVSPTRAADGRHVSPQLHSDTRYKGRDHLLEEMSQ